MATVKMVTPGELLGGKYKFEIPGYQCGYRWRSGENVEDRENSQVLQFLEDIREYYDGISERYKNRFYCLQPLVVLRRKDAENTYLLVDGQQRLTTFLLILLYLKYKELSGTIREEVEQELGDDATQREIKEAIALKTVPALKQELFSISYATKDGDTTNKLSDFLFSLPTLPAGNLQNGTTIDEYYMANAFHRIQEWFNKNKSYEIPFRNLMTVPDKTDVNGKIRSSLQFIWYELDDVEAGSQEKLFNRINKGKIPLTSAELIKAFIFGKFQQQSDSAKEKYHEAERKENNAAGENLKAEKWLKKINECDNELKRFEEEWEKCENLLFNDTFWNFMSSKEYNTRIEYIFELILCCNGEKDPQLCNGENVANPQHTFILFRRWFDGQNLEMTAFREIFFKFFQKIQKYYQDWHLYHLIGFLIHIGTPFSEIFEKLDQRNNIFQCVSCLADMIYDRLFIKNSKIFNDDAELQKVRSLKPEEGYSILNKKLELLDFSQKKILPHILLLFNIITLLKSNQRDRRFSFSQFRDNKWDLEHICSQKTEITNSKERENWLLSVLDYYTGSEFIDPPEKTENETEKKVRLEFSRDTIKKFINGLNGEWDLLSQEFDNILNSGNFLPADYTFNCVSSGNSLQTWKYLLLTGIIRTMIHEEKIKKCELKDSFNILFQITNFLEREGTSEPIASDNLKNLTLLDSRTNRTYHNAPFFVKRKHIIKVEGCGRFILPCTRNAFLKVYSKSLDNMLYWNPAVDGENHLNEISRTFVDFFTENN